MTPELLQNTKYILHFLLAATSYDASQDITVQPPTSQLAIQMEALPFNPVLTHWATNQFVGLWQIADAKNKCTTTNQQNIITPTNTETNNNINHAGLTAAATTQPGTTSTNSSPGPLPADQHPGMLPDNQHQGINPAAVHWGGTTGSVYLGTPPVTQ